MANAKKLKLPKPKKHDKHGINDKSEIDFAALLKIDPAPSAEKKESTTKKKKK